MDTPATLWTPRWTVMTGEFLILGLRYWTISKHTWWKTCLTKSTGWRLWQCGEKRYIQRLCLLKMQSGTLCCHSSWDPLFCPEIKDHLRISSQTSACSTIATWRRQSVHVSSCSIGCSHSDASPARNRRVPNDDYNLLDTQPR